MEYQLKPKEVTFDAEGFNDMQQYINELEDKNRKLAEKVHNYQRFIAEDLDAVLDCNPPNLMANIEEGKPTTYEFYKDVTQQKHGLAWRPKTR